ncbi:MAG: DoxX family protein [Bacteroidetes bacterium]|nr:DoxX family protein [Bacteroidota bacterium]
MPEFSLPALFQLLVAVGLLNVWLLRQKSATSYRGGDANNLKAEFAAYGLPDAAFFIVGALKIGAAVALLAGFWMPELIRPAASIVGILMVGAIAMHVKVGDPIKKSVPALLMLAMSAGILWL